MGSFVAVLELAKRGVVTLNQATQEDSISVTLRMNDTASDSEDVFVSEFDQDNGKVISLHGDMTEIDDEPEIHDTDEQEPEKRISNA